MPDPVARADQAKAAYDEVNPIVFEIGGRVLRNARTHDGDQAPLAAALMQAAAARVDRYCPHWAPDMSPQPVFIVLGPKVAACRPCMESAFARDRAHYDDSLCDVCQTKSEEFRPVIANIGGAVVFGDLCMACWQELCPDQR